MRKKYVAISVLFDMIPMKGGGESMNKKEVRKARTELVVKSNDLIRKSRYSLTVQQQKIILYLISKIKPEDTEFELYSFIVREFCDVCGIEYSGNYSVLMDTIKTLADKSIWINLPNGEKTIARWIEKPYINEGNSTIRIKMDKDMMPYLLQLKGNFTQFDLMSTLAMKSKNTIRIYEILKSYEHTGGVSLTVAEIKDAMNSNAEFPVFNDFKRKVIDKSIAEIQEYSGLHIEYTLMKDGRKAIGFNFTIEKTELGNETMLAEMKLNGEYRRRMVKANG